MFTKFSTFRNRGTSSQKGKQKRYEKFSSQQLHTTEEDVSSKSNLSYFSSKSLISDKTAVKGSYYANPVLPNSDASPVATHVSDGYSSLASFGTHSTYDGKESLTTSSAPYEEIDTGPPVLLPYEDAEEEFLEDHESYFLHLSVNNMRKDQYPKLELQRIVYLDYATCPLYSRYQVEQHMQFLLEETDAFLGSNSIIDKQTGMQNRYIDETCKQILNLLNTNQNEYSIIFTPGLSSCYRLFGEMYHFQKGSILLAGHDHHESVEHMVRAAALCNIKTGTLPLKNKDLCIHGSAMHKLLLKRGWSGHGCGLLVYPAQSFLSGVCHSLDWIMGARQNGWKVLLDVSSCLPMVSIDLSLCQPEFVIGSLHHMLGYPSGVGFLLVRRSSHSICNDKGSTKWKLAELPENGKVIHVVTEGESLNLHTFAALSFGLKHLESISIVAIQKRVESLIAWLVKTLKSLKHKIDEKPLLQLYGSLDLKYRGSILAFNVLDSTGNIFPARLVQQLAERSNIFLGAGNLINRNLANLLNQKSDKQEDTVNLYGSTYHLQVVRLSLGPVSTFDDVYRLAQFLSRFRDEDYMSSEAAGYVEELENEC